MVREVVVVLSPGETARIIAERPDVTAKREDRIQCLLDIGSFVMNHAEEFRYAQTRTYEDETAAFVDSKDEGLELIEKLRRNGIASGIVKRRIRTVLHTSQVHMAGLEFEGLARTFENFFKIISEELDKDKKVS